MIADSSSNDTFEELEELREEYGNSSDADGILNTDRKPCPRCGYCPNCGRDTSPFGPHYGSPYYL